MLDTDSIKDKALYTTNDVADMFGVTVTSVCRWISDGKLKAHTRKDTSRPFYMYGSDIKAFMVGELV